MKPIITPEVEEIYRQLERNRGRERVDDGNVGALIELAGRRGHQVVERELREWQATCKGTPSEPPPTMAPTRGFNRENVKH